LSSKSRTPENDHLHIYSLWVELISVQNETSLGQDEAWILNSPGKKKMKTAAKLPRRSITVVMLGTTTATKSVEMNQMDAIVTLLRLSPLAEADGGLDARHSWYS
jgi:hypothetical protein